MEKQMVDIIHRVGIRSPISKLRAAVSSVEGITGWLARNTSDHSGAVETVFESPEGQEMGRIGYKIEPEGDRVKWNFISGPAEWVGTELTFDLSRQGDYAVILFGHRNWRAPSELMAHSSMKWATFLLSLKQYAETGMGEPSPHDRRVGDWS
jgi:hypothetical protein